ncbi:MAG TPA: alpha/beta hydrolase [Kofleriaceae bacterium]|jgi:pimeloyl-ACP methyl ester carboxylesterase
MSDWRAGAISTIDGATLHASFVGRHTRTTPTIVFLHEGLGSIRLWRDTPEKIAMSADRCGAVLEREGYGASSPVAVPRALSYMHDEAKRLPAVLADLRISDVILVGHSDGASIALIAAGMGLVQPWGIVTIAPHVFVEDVSIASITKAADAFRNTDLRSRLAKYHDDVDGAFWGWNRAWLDPAFKKWNIEKYLPAITCPILVVQGDKDEYGTLEQIRKIERGAGGPVETEIVPRAGHAPYRDAPDLVHARIAAFIRGVIAS